jgi:F-type H+-transporting ATPase subunit delta
MSVDKLSKRYAKSLFDEAAQKGAVDAVYADLETIQSILKTSRDLKAVFNSPIIQNHKKMSIVKSVFEGRLHPLTFSLVRLLVAQNRDAYIADVINAFYTLYNESKGISEVTVTTAGELDAANEEKIIRFIKSKSGYPNVKINKKTDPSIIGGFIVDFGGKLYDNSIRYKLNKVTKELSLN